MFRHGARVLTFAAIGVLPGCDTPLTACTAVLTGIPLVVLTADGSPVPGLTISDTVLRTGQGFKIPGSGASAPGPFYKIFDDTFLSRIRPAGDLVRVVGTNATLMFSTDFVFDAPGGCHVHKVAGPDTVIVP